MGPPLLDIVSPISIRAQWARQHAIYGIKEEWNKLVRVAYGRRPDDKSLDVPELIKGDTLGEAPLKMRPKDGTAGGDTLAVKVGIVGAGAAGLFSALVLEYLIRSRPASSSRMIFSRPTRPNARAADCTRTISARSRTTTTMLGPCVFLITPS